VDLKGGEVSYCIFLVKKCTFSILPKLLDVGLEAYPYPPEEAEDATQPPIEISLRLPDNVMYFADPLIARWDPAGTNLGHEFILS